MVSIINQNPQISVSQNDTTIHVALSIWDLADEYNRHAAVTILSLLEHCDKGRHLVIHLLYDAVLSAQNQVETIKNMDRYRELISRFNAELTFNHIDADNLFSDIPASKIFTVGALYRLFLPELLPDVERILYLDCDMVVNVDISKLYDIDMGDYPLAAVVEGKVDSTWMSYYKQVGIIPEIYFNSGLLLFNSCKIRDSVDLIGEAISYFTKYPKSPYPDQDFLNWIFQKNYLHLDNKYNTSSVMLNPEIDSSECIIHYQMAIRKPWKSYNGVIDNYYWEYLVQTPWASDKQNIVSYARNTCDRELFIDTIPDWIYRYPIMVQVSLLWKMSGRLWLNLFLRYCREGRRRLFFR